MVEKLRSKFNSVKILSQRENDVIFMQTLQEGGAHREDEWKLGISEKKKMFEEGVERKVFM